MDFSNNSHPKSAQKPCADAQKAGTPASGQITEINNEKRKRTERKIKERKIRQLLAMHDIFDCEENYNSYYVVNFPGVHIDTELNVISTDLELKNKIGTASKISKLGKSSLLIELESKQQETKLLELSTIGNHPVTVAPHA